MIVGDQGPGVVLSARTCAWLEKYARLPALRVAARGVDPQVSAHLEEIRQAADAWRGSVLGTEVAATSEPATRSEWMTTAMVAELLQVGPRAVVKAIARGALPAQRVGRTWQVHREDAERYRTATPDPRPGAHPMRNNP